MDNAWNVGFDPCEKGQLYLVEFRWDGYGDRFAESRFRLWNPNPNESDPLLPVGSITKPRVQAYYMTGTRLFWMVVCADKVKDVEELCRKVSDSSPTVLSPISYDYWRCEDPQPALSE